MSALIRLLLFALFVFAGPAGAEDCPYDDDVLQIELEPGADIEQVENGFGVNRVESAPPAYLVALPTDSDEDAYISALLGSPLIRTAERVLRMQTPEATEQMMVAAVGGGLTDYVDQGASERLQLDQAHQFFRGAGTVVALLDTGADLDHEVLLGYLVEGYDFVDEDDDPTDTANGIDDDVDGLTDDAAGHGSIVAGLVHLVAPDAELMPLRVLDDEGRGISFHIVRAIQFAVENGAKVINLSVGGECPSELIENEIERAHEAGVVVVAAAGNTGSEARFYPASSALALSVTSVDSADVRADFATYDDTVDISAPGVGVLGPFHDGGYASANGTSFSAPQVAGQAALILSALPSLTPTEVLSIAKQGVFSIDSLPGNEPYAGKLGSGRIDALETWMTMPHPATVQSGLSSDGSILIFPNPLSLGRFAQLDLRSSSSPEGILDVFDPTGRRVHRVRTASGAIHWNGTDSRGHFVTPGLYALRWSTGNEVRTGTLVVTR